MCKVCFIFKHSPVFSVSFTATFLHAPVGWWSSLFILFHISGSEWYCNYYLFSSPFVTLNFSIFFVSMVLDSGRGVTVIFWSKCIYMTLYFLCIIIMRRNVNIRM